MDRHTGSDHSDPNGPLPDDIGSQEAGTARGQVPRGEGECTPFPVHRHTYSPPFSRSLNSLLVHCLLHWHWLDDNFGCGDEYSTSAIGCVGL